MRARLFTGVCMAVALILISGCSKADSPTQPNNNNPGATTVDVYTPGNIFSPSFVTITVGSTVRFNIAGSPEGHDVTFQTVTGAPQSVPVTITGVASRTFNTKGTFPFDCRTHPGMSGSVTVQ
jgi:plastocyanin